MDWEQIEEKWNQRSDSIKERWGKITDEDLTQIDGDRQQLVERLRERYGFPEDQAEKQIGQFLRSLQAAGEETEEPSVHRS